MTDHASGFAPVYKGDVYYETLGSGPAVLLVHAGVADSSMWQAQVEVFAQHFQVITYDARGYGKSRTESVSFSNRQDILDLLDHLGIDRAAVVGISRGGQIAVDFTVEHPERVWALVVVAGGVSGYDHQPDGSEKSKIEYEMFNQMEALWGKKELEALTDLEVRMWADGPGQPEGRAAEQVRSELYRMIRLNDSRQDGEATPQQLEPPAINRLSEIRVPTLVAAGDLDTTGTLAMAELMAAKIPGARKIIFTGAAHMIPMEQPERFNQEVLNFLRSNQA
jgi:pimeloyl-ACP methyl ester carboxylesterase